ncbi:MAG: PIG-L family deacetylase [Verrucomicrobia bacterium]|nr:PIG-L family deacetylase [Verrucomicrobiota bacterium]
MRALELTTRRFVHCATISVAIVALVNRDTCSAGSVPASAAAIEHELRSFGTVAAVLHIAAHPDDENTQLITYFARKRGYRTAYLSLTRGDGGQNEIGPEFGEKLGVARTQELLAARRLDGGRQFFTRAIDFGYSKTPEETLRFWNRDQVLGDVVRIIRQFRPDVIVTRFPIPPGSGGHGHHTASGILGFEAFKLAGDPGAYPEQFAEGLSPWQPKRVLWNGGGGGRGGGAVTGPTVRVDIGGADPVTGEGLGTIASRSRGMHITQGFGSFGGRGGSGPNEQTFTLLSGDPAEKDIMDGIDVTWARFPNGGAEIGQSTEKAISAFNPNDPAGSVPELLAIRTKLAALANDSAVNDKRQQLDGIIQACLGLSVETTTPLIEVVPGEPLTFHHKAVVRSKIPVRLLEVRVPDLGGAKLGIDLESGLATSGEIILGIPETTPLTHPYWLREEPSAGMFRVADTKLIGQPENSPPFSFEYVFEVSGQKLIVTDEPLAATEAGRPGRRLAIISPVSLRFSSGVALFSPGAKKTVEVEIVSARASMAGTLGLETPAGWAVSPASQPFKLGKSGEKARLTFSVSAPAQPASGNLLAYAEIGGTRFSNQRVEVRYEHIPVQLLQPEARLKVAAFDVATRGKMAGYLPGAGDDTREALEQLGYKVTTLTGADLTPEKLRRLDVVVIGVRAFNERDDLSGNLPGLFAYVEAGGTVVAQYNRPNGLKARTLGPYDLSIEGSAPRQRVTDENSPVTILQPENPALTTPNRIGPEDFTGWVQERGAYFPSSWNEAHYSPVLAMNDPGEAPLQSGILIARHGQGYFVYTGLAFFRQLPAGVPGAYRLFANLISLGK